MSIHNKLNNYERTEKRLFSVLRVLQQSTHDQANTTETAVEKMEERPQSPLLFSNKSLGILRLLQIVRG